MMKKNILMVFILLVQFAEAAPEVVSKVGTEIQFLKTPNSTGILFGWRYTHHRSELFSIGGAGYTGQLSATNGSFTYGGLTASFHASIGQSIRLEMGILAGGGGGSFADGTQGGGTLLVPNGSIAFVLGKTVRLALNSGYIYFPNSAPFGGLVAGIRFEFVSGDEG